MGNVGVPELIFIFILALLIFGPRKLPELGRSLGKALAEFRRASADLRMTIEDEMRELERQTQQAGPEAREAAASPPDGPVGSGSIAPPPPGLPAEDSSEEKKPADGDAKPA